MHGKSPSRFFSKEEESEIVRAIQVAERLTSGEIRVHLVRGKTSDLLEEGKKIFADLGMTKTRERNGILFLLDVKHHHFAVLGDQGIHERVGAGFWEEIRQEMERHFKEGRFGAGLSSAILRCGEKLKAYFPAAELNSNELPDELSSEQE